MTEFERVVPALHAALEKRGYAALTPVQKAVLAAEPAGADALVSAQTGSGKTVAFGLALAPSLLDGADRFEEAAAPLALVVAPTRELAMQVRRELEWLYGETGARIASCVGGMDYRSEKRALERGAHIVVGTPGRLRDHITRNSLDTSGLRAVVLDEADEMLDLGFREDLEFILESAPAERRTLMFSATVPPTIATLAKRYQRDAVRITTADEQAQHLDIEYRVHPVASYDRENAIINVLRFHEAGNALVFCATRATVTHLTARFNNRGFAVVALSGELSQNERTHALQAMRDGRARVCIATDVAARGIDLPNLDLVIHADLPINAETLVHRSGRTGRAGRKGVSVLIVPNNRRRQAERLLANAGIDAEWCKPPSADEVRQRDDERLLGDPFLSDPVAEEEEALVRALLDRHGAEQVAAAFLRRSRAGQSAPEELAEVSAQDLRKPEKRAPDAPRRPREDFDDSVWFAVSVGRRQRAEPRWVLPMLCRAGDITKRDVGAIKLQADVTYVQITAESADGFEAAVAAKGPLENGVTVTRLDGPPDLTQEPRAPFEGRKPHADKKPYRDKKPHREKKPYGEQKRYEGRASDEDKASFEGGKPYRDKKPYEGKKPHAGKKARERGASDDEGRGAYGDKKPYRDRKPYEGRKPHEGKKPYEKKPYDPGRRDERGEAAPKRAFERKSRDLPVDEPRSKKPNPALDPNWKPGRKPAGKAAGRPGGKPGGKKPFKPKFAKSGGAGGKPGSGPLKRKPAPKKAR